LSQVVKARKWPSNPPSSAGRSTAAGHCARKSRAVKQPTPEQIQQSRNRMARITGTLEKSGLWEDAQALRDCLDGRFGSLDKALDYAPMDQSGDWYRRARFGARLDAYRQLRTENGRRWSWSKIADKLSELSAEGADLDPSTLARRHHWYKTVDPQYLVAHGIPVPASRGTFTVSSLAPHGPMSGRARGVRHHDRSSINRPDEHHYR
jgi:hypothetical protein